MYSGICRTGKLCTPLDLTTELAITDGGTGFFGNTISGVNTGGFEGGTGNIETMGGCCTGGAGCGFLGPMTAVTLTSPPDKALA